MRSAPKNPLVCGARHLLQRGKTLADLPGRKPPGKAVKRKPDRQPAPKGGGPPPPSPKVNKNRLSALGAGPSGTSGSHERAPPRSPSPSSPPAKSPRPSVPASEYDSEFDFSDAEAQDRTAGVVHDAVQQAVMQYGYDDELFQAWRDGERSLAGG